MAQIVLMIGNHQLCGGRRELPDDYLKVKSHIRYGGLLWRVGNYDGGGPGILAA
jgi:hypothetical protein